MKIALMALCSIALSVAAQFLFKAGMSSPAVREALAQPLSLTAAVAALSNSAVLGGFVLYGFGALTWLGVLAKWDVSKAYPMVGLGFAMAVIVGWMAGEQVSLARALGVAMICGGVFLVGRS